MEKELANIKKKYGEEMMHFCKEHFAAVLEHEGLLFDILSNFFAYSKMLIKDIKEENSEEKFIQYILSIYNHKQSLIETDKTPFELMDEAGYTLYECHSEADIQSFKKYYEEDEELCTFRGGRLNRCHVFFAVKKNVDEIKREDFPNPKREDAYGTSVISIQFDRGEFNNVSIKNRYNHTVDNPDATFGNDLEKIIPGLTNSFQKKYHFNILLPRRRFNLEYYFIWGKKFYKSYYIINDIAYCPNNNILCNGVSLHLADEKCILADYFIIDLQEKKIKLYDKNIVDGFAFDDVMDKITVTNTKDGKRVYITKDNIFIDLILDKENCIISCKTNEEILAPGYFMYLKNIKEYYNDKVYEISDGFLEEADNLEKLYLPKVRYIGDNFLRWDTSLEEINLPALEKAGSCFMENSIVSKVSFPNLRKVGAGFMESNVDIEKINLPKLESADESFMKNANNLSMIVFPSLVKVNNDFLGLAENVLYADFPKLKKIGNSFLYYASNLTDLYLPEVEEIGTYFLYCNESLEEIDLPKVVEIGDRFMMYNSKLKKLDMPNVQVIGDEFLETNESLTEISLPKLKEIGDYSLTDNSIIDTVFMPELETCGINFLRNATLFKNFDFSSLKNFDNSISRFIYTYVYFRDKLHTPEGKQKLKGAVITRFKKQNNL